MGSKIIRVGTVYLPVNEVVSSAEWYVEKLGAVVSYQDEDKAIVNFANQSFFLVKAAENQSANFKDQHGKERFSITFEVDGVENLISLRQELAEKEVQVGEIEDRGHPGKNFVFYDPNGNIFDVWSELSPGT
jgi:catechol-2,3-dioxygenase